VVPYSSTEEEEKEEDSFLNVLYKYESWGKNEDSTRVQKKIFARRARVIKGKCWREGTFVRVCICTTLRTIYEG